MNVPRNTHRPPGNWRALRVNAALTVVVFLVIGALFVVFLRKRTDEQRRMTDRAATMAGTSRPVTMPAAQPTTGPSTTPAEGPPVDYAGIVRQALPALRATEPLVSPLDLRDAAVIKLSSPLYICGRGDLWITRADAPPDTGSTLTIAEATQTHLIRERPAFVWWQAGADAGRWYPWLACRAANGYEWIGPGSHRVAMPTDETFDWPRAIFWRDDAVVVPTTRGVAIIRFGENDRPTVDAIDLLDPDTAAAEKNGSAEAELLAPQFVTDAEGVLAWVPPGDDARPRGRGVARYVDGRWSMLDAARWPASTLQLVPLADGTIVRLITEPAAGGGMNPKVTLSLEPLTAGAVDEAKVTALVEQLSERDPRARQAAFLELTQFGPGAWPVLEKLRDDQPPEAQLRIGQLLRERTRPSLAGMSAVDDQLQVVARDRAGGVVLYAGKGVSIDDASARPNPQVVAPAWIALRPGRAAELLPETLVGNLKPRQHQLDIIGQDWLVTDAIHGPRRYLGRKLVKLLPTDDAKVYHHVIGIDRRGRWVFSDRGPADTAAPDDRRDVRMLILDPTLPDPTPRLPGWAIGDTTAAGWTVDGWPAVTVKGKNFKLMEAGWSRLDPRKETLITAMPIGPTTTPTLLWTGPDGSTYADGTSKLVFRGKAGTETTLPLPVEAAGQPPVHLAVLADRETLLLMNTPGRIVRLKRGHDGQLTVEATFTNKVPNGPIRRFWLDPAGRLCVAHDASSLTVLFPAGVVPSQIRRMMPMEELEGEK
jgi:hypothetical protein